MLRSHGKHAPQGLTIPLWRRGRLNTPNLRPWSPKRRQGRNMNGKPTARLPFGPCSSTPAGRAPCWALAQKTTRERSKVRRTRRSGGGMTVVVRLSTSSSRPPRWFWPGGGCRSYGLRDLFVDFERGGIDLVNRGRHLLTSRTTWAAHVPLCTTDGLSFSLRGKLVPTLAFILHGTLVLLLQARDPSDAPIYPRSGVCHRRGRFTS